MSLTFEFCFIYAPVLAHFFSELVCLLFSCLFIIVYDVSGGAGDRNCVVLNDIHIDIMDYIVPASCTDSEFRQMWAEFEWENKVKLTSIHLWSSNDDPSYSML